jgi:hypothetical protein
MPFFPWRRRLARLADAKLLREGNSHLFNFANPDL